MKLIKYKDKLLHFALNMAGAMFGCVMGCCFTSIRCGTCIAIALCIGLSVGKEYGDKNATGNHWCWWDLLADLLGIIAGVFVFRLLYQLAIMLVMAGVD